MAFRGIVETFADLAADTGLAAIPLARNAPSVIDGHSPPIWARPRNAGPRFIRCAPGAAEGRVSASSDNPSRKQARFFGRGRGPKGGRGALPLLSPKQASAQLPPPPRRGEPSRDSNSLSKRETDPSSRRFGAPVRVGYCRLMALHDVDDSVFAQADFAANQAVAATLFDKFEDL
jgi:hypothetical protein